MTHPGTQQARSRRERRGAAGLAAVVAVAVGIAAAGPNAPAPPSPNESVPKVPAPSEEIDRHLARLDITGALASYDAIALQTGPSLDLLVRIARADLLFCMREGKGWDRFEAVQVLAEHGDPVGQAALTEYLESDSATFRTGAMDLLEPPGAAAILARLRARSADPHTQPRERVRAARALYRLGEKRAAVQALQAVAESKEVTDRGDVARALAALEDPAALGPLRALRDDPAPVTALVAALGLMRLGDASGRERLVAALAAPEPQERILAASHLAQAHDRAGFATVQQLVEEGFAVFPDLQKLHYDLAWAIYVLSWIDPAAARPSLDRMAATAGWLVGGATAGRRLAELGDQAGLAVLERVNAEAKGNISLVAYRIDLLRSAGWLGDLPRVRALAKEAVDDPSPHMRATALEILARLGDPTALPAAREMLGAIGLIYRSRAAGAILAFGTGPESPPGMGGLPETVPGHSAGP